LVGSSWDLTTTFGRYSGCSYQRRLPSRRCFHDLRVGSWPGCGFLDQPSRSKENSRARRLHGVPLEGAVPIWNTSTFLVDVQEPPLGTVVATSDGEAKRTSDVARLRGPLPIASANGEMTLRRQTGFADASIARLTQV